MGKTQVTLHFNQFLALRRDVKTKDVITSAARSLAGKANEMKKFKDAHYTAVPAQDTAKGSIALVSTSSESGKNSLVTRLDQHVNHTLQKALSGGEV